MTIETVEERIKIMYGKYPGLENANYNFFWQSILKNITVS